MNYIELSLKELRDVSIGVAEKIVEEQEIDLLIYVARAGFPIALYMNEIINVPLLGIGAQRKGNKLKNFLGIFVKCLPNIVRNILISLELKMNVHKHNSERQINFHESIKELDTKKYKNILLVDDSVDTGHSMKQCLQEIKKYFPEANIITYSLNVWEKSKKLFMTDYYSYSDTIIKAPMSKDAKEYRKFCELYREKTKNGYI